MAIDPNYLRNIAPELDCETDGRLNFFIGIAVNQMPVSIWGNKLDFATALYACHLLTMFNRKGNAQTSQEKVGDIMRQYAVPKTKDDAVNYLASTAYGMQLYQLIKTRVTTPYIIGDDGNSNPGKLQGPFGFATSGWPWY